MKAENNIHTRLYRANSLRRKQKRGYFELLTRYEEELLNGKNPDPRKFLEKCPESEKEKMVLSLNLATLFLSGKKKTKKDNGRINKQKLEKAQRRCYTNIVKNRR